MRFIPRRSILTTSFMLLILFSLIGTTPATAQEQTYGLFINDTLSQQGYTLFAPNRSTTTYLIDNYGRVVNTWESTRLPSLSVYLLEDGTLLRSASPGGAQILDWDGTVLWDFVYMDTNYHQHHDIELLPNGNVLLLVQGNNSYDDALAAGRDTSLLTTDGLNTEFIVEIQPIGSDSGIVVWKWDLWDHFVQDFDPTKDNFGVVADHPELLDINFDDDDNEEWVHANGIAYNENLDQISISFRNTSEFMIIDHSTTTAEASSHAGGNIGRGGDFIYRWGNPQAYDAGTEVDQELIHQHNAHWIPDGLNGAGNILVFNNGDNRPSGESYSTVEEIVTPVDGFGNYTWPSPGEEFGPSTSAIVFIADNPTDFYSRFVSGAQRLPNGNTIICEGFRYHFFEVTPGGDIVWDYKSSVGSAEIIPQWDNAPSSTVFRCIRYTPDYPGLQGKDLTPGAPIELYPFTVASTTHTPAIPELLEDVTVTTFISTTEITAVLELMVDIGAGFIPQILYDDGAHGDGAAGDSLYGTTIPGQPAGTMVRYYVRAEENPSTVILDPPSAPTTTYRYRVPMTGLNFAAITLIEQQINLPLLVDFEAPTPGNPWVWTASALTGFAGTPNIIFNYQNAEQTSAEMNWTGFETTDWLNGTDGSFTLTLANGVDPDHVYPIQLSLRSLLADGYLIFSNQTDGEAMVNQAGAEGFIFGAAQLSGSLVAVTPGNIIFDNLAGIDNIGGTPTWNTDGTFGLELTDGTRPMSYVYPLNLGLRTLNPNPLEIANDGLASSTIIEVMDDIGPFDWSGYIDGLPVSILSAADVSSTPMLDVSWLDGELQTNETGTGEVYIQLSDLSTPGSLVSVPTSIIPFGCCGTYAAGYPGNTDCDTEGKRNLADITMLIDNVYISKADLCCEANGNVDADLEGKLNLADITLLIDHVYISKNETPPCL